MDSCNTIDTLFQEACERVPAGGTLIICFTGHGVRVDGADYLVPQDYTRLATGGRHRRDRLVPLFGLECEELT